MFTLLVRLLKHISYALRHRVLEYAHPLPETIRIFPGAKGSLHRAIMTDLIDVCNLPHVEVVEVPERNRPTVWIEHEHPIAGCMTVCRYLGRHWRLLPINPTTCAMVDSSLELLQSFMYPFVAESFTESIQMCDHVAVFAMILEDTFDAGETDHLNGFASDTLADVCWAAAWKHVMDMEGVTLSASDYPNLRAWMEYQGIIAEDDEDEDEDEDEDREDKKDL